MSIVSVIVSIVILVGGFSAGMHVPKLVQHSKRTTTMLGIWAASLVLSMLVFWGII